MHGTVDSDDSIANAEHDFPALQRFLAAYFHEDWQEEHAATNAVVAAYLRDAPAATVAATAGDIDRLLGMPLDDASLSQLLRDGFDCNYVPEVDEVSARAWLERLRGQMRRPPRD